jgi:hypothetical protein
VSVRPISYICKLPKEVQRRTGRAANTSKRSPRELKQGVEEWVAKKYRKRNKQRLLASLGHGEWTEELVVHIVKSKHELELIRSHGIRILPLTRILRDLRAAKTRIRGAAGSDLWELMHLAS